MKIRLPVSVLLFLFLLGCAGGPQIAETPPDWSKNGPEDTKDSFSFRGLGQDDLLAVAKDKAYNDLIDSVVLAMELGEQSFWSANGVQVVSDFRSELERALRNPESLMPEGMSITRKDAWRGEDKSIVFAVEILWDRNAFLEQSRKLMNAVGVASAAFRDLEQRAWDAESDGNVYESALIWAAAAGMASSEGFPAGFRLALQQIPKVLSLLNYEIVSAPELVSVGQRPDTPVVFSVSANSKPVGNAEFLIRYPWLTRDGTPSVETARILTDSAGRLRFLPPEVRFPGAQIVSIAPSALPFLENLVEPYDSSVDSMVASLERPASEVRYEALSRTRDIRTGLLVLETDLAGNPLESTTTVKGILDDLVAENFSVDLMPLDPREMLSRTERALLRDLKADPRFSETYGRVIFGTIKLDGFEQDGNAYAVRVSGSLALADIDRQVVIYRSELTKTSRAADSQQAVTAAFRQLGRSFAREVIDLAP